MLRLSGIAVDAISVGGMRTCIQLPGLDVAFDMGCCPRAAVHRRTVLFTHAHIDHMGAVIQHCATRSLLSLSPPRYVIPPENADAFADLLAVWRRLDRSELNCEVLPIGPGGQLTLRRDVVVRPIRAIHRVPTQGYVLWRQKKKLKAMWRGRSGAEIQAARQAGEAVTDCVETPEVAFTGDSRAEIFEREPTLMKAKVLIVEVTFLDDRVSGEKTRQLGHIHLDDILARAERFDNEAILMTHLSARYRADEAERILDARLPPALRERVTLLRPPARET